MALKDDEGIESVFEYVVGDLDLLLEPYFAVPDVSRLWVRLNGSGDVTSFGIDYDLSVPKRGRIYLGLVEKRVN